MSRRSKKGKKKLEKRIASSQPSEEENKQESPTDSHSQPSNETQNRRTIIKSVTTQPSSKEDERHDDEKKYWEKQIRQAKMLNWITGCAMAAGLITLYFLNATFRQNIETVKLQQRAWVIVAEEGAEFVYGLKPNQLVQVNIRYKNTGNTPATHVVSPNGIAIGPNALSQIQKRPMPKTPGSLAVLASQGTAITTTKPFKGFTEDQLNAFMKGDTIENNTRIVVFGTIYYRDIFQDPHET